MMRGPWRHRSGTFGRDLGKKRLEKSSWQRRDVKSSPARRDTAMGGGYVPPHLRGSRGASASASARARGRNARDDDGSRPVGAEAVIAAALASRDRRKGSCLATARSPRRRRARCADGGVARDPQRVGGRDERLAGVLGGEPGQKARRDPGAGGVSVRDRVGDARRRPRRAAGTLSARRRGRGEPRGRGAVQRVRGGVRGRARHARAARQRAEGAGSGGEARQARFRRALERARPKARQRPDPERGLARDRRRRARVFGERAGGDRRDFREQRGARPRAAGVAARRANVRTRRRRRGEARRRRGVGVRSDSLRKRDS